MTILMFSITMLFVFFLGWIWGCAGMPKTLSEIIAAIVCNVIVIGLVVLCVGRIVG